MANYKRKRVKRMSLRYCGYRSCKQDQGHEITTNGRERYLPTYWKKFDGSRPWRYIHKNV